MDLVERVLIAAKRLTGCGDWTYDQPRGDDTPIPTCVGCGSSSWGTINHYKDCAVEELIAAVKALARTPQ